MVLTKEQIDVKIAQSEQKAQLLYGNLRQSKVPKSLKSKYRRIFIGDSGKYGAITNDFRLESLPSDVVKTLGQVATTASHIIEDPFNPLTYIDEVPRTAVSVINTGSDVIDTLKPLTNIKNQEKIDQISTVNTTNMPTAFVNSVKSQDFKVSTAPYKAGGLPVTRVHQTINKYAVKFPATTSPSGITAFANNYVLVDELGDRFFNVADSFDRWKPIGIQFSYVTNSASSVEGTVHMLWSHKPTTKFGGSPAGISIEDASQLQESYTVAWGSATLDTTFDLEPDRWFYTGEIGTVGDSKFFSPGWFGIGTAGNTLSAHSGVIGYVNIKVIADFCSPKAPDSTFLMFLSSSKIHCMLSRVALTSMFTYSTDGTAMLLDMATLALGETLDKFQPKSTSSIQTLYSYSGKKLLIEGFDLDSEKLDLIEKYLMPLQDEVMNWVKKRTQNVGVVIVYTNFFSEFLNPKVVGINYMRWLSCVMALTGTRGKTVSDLHAGPLSLLKYLTALVSSIRDMYLTTSDLTLDKTKELFLVNDKLTYFK